VFLWKCLPVIIFFVTIAILRFYQKKSILLPSSLVRRELLELSSLNSTIERFRVLQFNVLADYLCFGGPDNFSAVSDQTILEWEFRKDLLLASLVNFDPDIMGLEEVDHFYDTFQPYLLRDGYLGLFHPKPKSANVSVKPPPKWGDGVALFYKENKYDLIDHQFYNFYQQNQVAILARFRTKQSKREFCVAVTHLKAKREFSETRLTEGKELLEAIAKFTFHNHDIPVIICGDFNDIPESPVCGYFRNPISSSLRFLQLKSVQDEIKNRIKDEELYSTFKYREKSGLLRLTIDYIWYTSKTLRPSAFLMPPKVSDLPSNGLPATNWPSDHISLLVELYFV